jgi:tetratricopeptide (TPR) repeat protein
MPVPVLSPSTASPASATMPAGASFSARIEASEYKFGGSQRYSTNTDEVIHDVLVESLLPDITVVRLPKGKSNCGCFKPIEFGAFEEDEGAFVMQNADGTPIETYLLVDEGIQHEHDLAQSKAVEVWRKALAQEKDPKRLIIAMRKIAEAYKDQGFFDDAIKMYQAELKVQRAFYGVDNEYTATTIGAIANCYDYQRNGVVAKQYYQEAAALMTRVDLSSPTFKEFALMNLADCNFSIGEYTEAANVYKQIAAANPSNSKAAKRIAACQQYVAGSGLRGVRSF